MSLFEVIDLGDDVEPPAVLIIDAESQNHATLKSVSPDFMDVDNRSENGSIDAFDTIFLSDNEFDSDSSDDVIFEAARPRRQNRQKRTRVSRNPAVESNDTLLDQLKINGLFLEPHVNVQLQYGTLLQDRSVLGNGYFMRIKRILRRNEVYKDGTEMTQTCIQGPLFRRNRDLDGILPKTAGEVALLREKAEARAVDAVNIRNIILTNHLGRDTVRKSYEDAKDDVYGRLICRWKAKIKDNTNGNTGIQQLGATGYIRRLTEAEADPDYRVSDMELSKSWRALADDEFEGKSQYLEKRNFDKVFDIEAKDIRLTENIPMFNQYLGERLQRTTTTSISVDEVISSRSTGAWQPCTPFLIADQDYEKPKNYSNNQSLGGKLAEIKSIQTTKFIDLTVLPTSPPIEDLQFRGSERHSYKSHRRYTFGDAFCGAGGATCGAVMAGFKVRWGVDHDEAAIHAWKSNFGRTLGYQEDVHEFVHKHDKRKIHVDLLHLSPPCQFFSWARTIPGKDDEKNEASFFVVPNTLNACRPRAVTVEETDGLVGLSRSVGHFKCMLGDFTSMGYSVKYAILNAAAYGVPSKRKRLVLIACCPGETLADFPNPTHFYSSDPFEPMPVGLKRAVTLREAIGRIPRYALDHDIEILETVAPSSLRLPPHEWDQPFRSTIKCGGGEYNLHPSRNRKFTLRELASLQSFPLDHRFHGKKGEKMRQIGNAFPPKLVGAVMESVRKHLEKTDDEWEGGGIL
ncbi:hypothetical protein ABW20_dc0110130 [Dactylellina cionopaga]|nr:hypothetical protein ABW20_dc0110130 [Dactylellina cionopaga]